MLSVIDYIRSLVPKGSKVRLDSVEIDSELVDIKATVQYPIDPSKVFIRIK